MFVSSSTIIRSISLLTADVWPIHWEQIVIQIGFELSVVSFTAGSSGEFDQITQVVGTIFGGLPAKAYSVPVRRAMAMVVFVFGLINVVLALELAPSLGFTLGHSRGPRIV
ncbi:hypothetical protein FRC18_010396 [Serendipita sp. 400]|nr:hypothetical protein FRC18_010396 [Serendipita sp. 400]